MNSQIETCDSTWNPITGCNHACGYCYAKRMAKRLAGRYGYPKINPFTPTFHRDRLIQPMLWKKSRKIFVCSMGDLWGRWVSKHDIDIVLFRCATLPRHVFQFLTKNPVRYRDFNRVPNAWYGTTIDGLPFTEGNLEKLVHSTMGAKVRFISFEPLLTELHPNLYDIDWIIIGADSSRGAKKPPKEWADILIDYARGTNTAVWMKDNYGYGVKIKEWPK
ncbi:hypothetical protein LCGC14_0763620 [marine sediment metagenome]|uniref:Phage protein Gp37/Gp68 n=1 Tax=marine sediment metagenome TaxID=412755 RepID=A0A0F9Q4H8_9ZZZZ